MSSEYPHPLTKNYYWNSVIPLKPVFLSLGCQNPLLSHEAPLVFHHQFRKTTPAFNSPQRLQFQGNMDYKDCPAIGNSHKAKSSETLQTDKVIIYS